MLNIYPFNKLTRPRLHIHLNQLYQLAKWFSAIGNMDLEVKPMKADSKDQAFWRKPNDPSDPQ